MIVIPTGNMVRCPDCGLAIPINPRKPKENPLYCPDKDCGAPLYIESEEGNQLNFHWAILPITARMVGDLFGIDRFPSEAISQRWSNSMKNHQFTPVQVLVAAEDIKRNTEGQYLGGSCFTMVLARLEKKGNILAREPEQPTRKAVFIPDGEQS